LVAKSLEGEIKFDDSEKSEMTDNDEDILCKNQTIINASKYSPNQMNIKIQLVYNQT